MAKITYFPSHLKDPKKIPKDRAPSTRDKSHIMFRVSNAGKQFTISSGIDVLHKHWINNQVHSGDNNSASKNRTIKQLHVKLEDILIEAIGKGINADRAYFKCELEKDNKVLTFWEVWDEYIGEKEHLFKQSSLKKVKSLKVHLEAFEKHIKEPLSLDNINEKILNKLRHFFYETRNLNTGTTAKYIGVLKMFLNWAVKLKYTKNIDYKTFENIQQKDSLKVALSVRELQSIRDVKIPQAKNYLRNVRSLFILSCKTGLRYSDYTRIKEQNIKQDENGDYYLQITQEKTSNPVELPLTDEALEIVQDLLSGEVHPITNQRMNEYVKELCKLAGLNEPFAVRRYVGKNYTETVKKKYELISTHTGRRTFATNLLLKGVPAQVVMQFTGHKDAGSFALYVNIPTITQRNIVKTALIEDVHMKIAN